MQKNIVGPNLRQFREDKRMGRSALARQMQEYGRAMTRKRLRHMEEGTWRVYDRDLALFCCILDRCADDFFQV